MTVENRVDKLFTVVAKPIGRELPRGGFAGAMGPFDTSPPNQHESKVGFLAEKNVVLDADVRRPAKWALSQLTDEDLMPEMPAALGGLLRFDPFGGADNPDNALSQYVAEKRTKG